MNGTRILRAGPLEMLFSAGDLRHVRVGQRTVLERIYVAVRDRNWGTVPGRIENLSIEHHAREFRIEYDCVHQEGEIDFRWHATIIGTATGGLSFAMDGAAHSTFLRNRIGFCVHHPLRECAGKPCAVESAGGVIERLEFPEFVSPHQPFVNVRAITHEVAPGLRAEVRFEGDVFETEDHRNWTDANFKTYGTPLSLPFPVEVKPGEEIHQKVALTLDGPVETGAPSREDVVRVRVCEEQAGRLPALGLCVAGHGRPLSDGEAAMLRRLRLSHIRVDAALGDDPRSAFERAEAEARALGTRLEAAITLPGDAGCLSAWTRMVDWWLIYDAREKATGDAAAKAVRDALGPDAFLAVGTNAYFAELNRNRPDGDAWDAACFSVNPQVHAFDDESVMANAAAQFDAVRTAGQFLRGKPVAVSPVTLRPRFNPDATSAVQPAAPDPRQKLPFCAAWTVRSLKSLAEAGATSVTYYETHGPGGVLDGAEVYPVFAVFEAAGEFAGASVLRSEASDSGRIATLVLASGAKRRMLVANLTAEPCVVQTELRPEPLALAPYEVERIDWNAD